MLFRMMPAAAVAILLWGAAGDARAARSSNDPLLATPEGVTLQVVKAARGGGMYGNSKRYYDTSPARDNEWVFGSSEGKTAYTYAKDEPGKSNCVDACAQAWPPLLALPKTVAFGDWSLIKRADGGQQWAFKGKPLYTFAKDEKPGEAKGNGAGEGAWRPAQFMPVAGMAIPQGFGVRSVAFAVGHVLTGESNISLYVFDGDVRKENLPCTVSSCANGWVPILAPELARPMGDFTIVTRADFTKQWAFKGKGLYRFTGDYQQGTANGIGVHPKMKAAYVVRYYLPPEVDMLATPQRGEVLATTSGLTLYKREFHYGYNIGRGRPGGTPGNPYMGRLMGTQGCNEVCQREWKPFVAPASARPWGYWEIVTRPEGTRQWAYKGYVLYTYVGDKKAGDINGNHQFDIQIDDPSINSEGPRIETQFTNALYWVHMDP